MKIVYLVHQFYPESGGGIERITLNLARMMQNCGHKVKVLTYSFAEPAFYEYGLGPIAIRELVYRGIPVLAFRHRDVPADIDFRLESPELTEAAMELMRRERPDIVHVEHAMRVGELLRSANESGTPYIVTLTDFFLLCPKSTLIRSSGSLCHGPESGNACLHHCPELPSDAISARLTVARRFMTDARLIAAPSLRTADLFQREFGVQRIKLIPFGVSSRMRTDDVRHYSNGAPIVFGYAGPLGNHKDERALIEAFMSVDSSNASLKIYRLHAGPEESQQALLTDLAAKDPRIQFCGVYDSEEAGHNLRKVDVLIVSPTSYETDPLILNDALAAGVPVVAPDMDTITEMVQDGFNGIVFRTGDTEHLASSLQKIIDHPAVLNPLLGNIRRMTFPTTEQEAWTYERVYNQACVRR